MIFRDELHRLHDQHEAFRLRLQPDGNRGPAAAHRDRRHLPRLAGAGDLGHHTSTNVLGKGRDIGYGVLRVTRDQPWYPAAIGQPIYNLLLALLFEWGVGLHGLDLEKIRKPQSTRRSSSASSVSWAARSAGRSARTT